MLYSNSFKNPSFLIKCHSHYLKRAYDLSPLWTQSCKALRDNFFRGREAANSISKELPGAILLILIGHGCLDVL